uniref:Membrane-bound transcription factor site-2 protease n=1 Tax=Phallusia mammillata TaxID=59560 RepID=A0A6F9DL16_9ASCI|nr:membrane-bound transcription factor site-2 protease [Phallusia mammillata]
MLPTTFVAIVLASWSSFHLLHNFICTNAHTSPAVSNFLQNNNIFVTPFQVRWFTQRWNRWIVKLGRSWNLKIWFDLGVLFGGVSMVAATALLIHTLLTSIKDLPFFREPSQLASPQVLTVIVPGINLPLKDIWYLLSAVLISGILHELGHALAAASEGVKMNGFGMFMFVIYPGAFVDLNSEDLNKANTKKQLRIYCAGVWHNFAICIIACALILLLPFILTPVYAQKGQGVVVTFQDKMSPLQGESGLHLGDKILSLDHCSISTAKDWLQCLNLTIHTPQAGSCISVSQMNALELTDGKLQPSSTAGNRVDCCGSNPPATHLCYQFQTDSDERFSCLPGRTVIAGRPCVTNDGCNDKQMSEGNQRNVCVVPYLETPARFLRIVASRNFPPFAKHHVLYLGDPVDLLRFISVSEYEPRFSPMPLQLPAVMLKFLQYMFSMSGALALLNIVPCYALDGQWAFKTFLDHFYVTPPNLSHRKELIYKIVLGIGTLLVASNILFGFAHILTR